MHRCSAFCTRFCSIQDSIPPLYVGVPVKFWLGDRLSWLRSSVVDSILQQILDFRINETAVIHNLQLSLHLSPCNHCIVKCSENRAWTEHPHLWLFLDCYNKISQDLETVTDQNFIHGGSMSSVNCMFTTISFRILCHPYLVQNLKLALILMYEVWYHRNSISSVKGLVCK
jgi:hypothetical protein